jgi:hypothetical protein
MGKLEADRTRSDQAIALYHGAIELLEPLAAGRAPAPQARADLTFIRCYLARVLVVNSALLDEAERRLRRAIELREALAAEHPDDAEYGTDLSLSLNNLAELQFRAGRTAEALASIRRARLLQQNLARRCLPGGALQL